MVQFEYLGLKNPDVINAPCLEKYSQLVNYTSQHILIYNSNFEYGLANQTLGLFAQRAIETK